MTDLGSYLAENTPAFFARAACRTTQVRQAVAAGTVDFFPGRGKAGSGKFKPTAPQAKALYVCAGCPVKAECLDYALTATAPTLVGIWGGTHDNERSVMRRMSA